VRGFTGGHCNPSSSHARGAGPSFSLWEKAVVEPYTFSSRNSRSHGLIVRMKVSYSACFTWS
jgi:hypothetical protein